MERASTREYTRCVRFAQTRSRPEDGLVAIASRGEAETSGTREVDINARKRVRVFVRLAQRAYLQVPHFSGSDER